MLVTRSSSVAAVSSSQDDSQPPISCTPIGDDSKGYFIQPTVILTKNPQTVTMVEEIFGPVMTVRIHVADALLLTDGVLGLRL